MSYRLGAREFPTVNNYIYGGTGGLGGEGRYRGQGGSGGAGEGPTLDYHVDTEHFVVNNLHYDNGSGIDILHRAVALEALYDSAESFPQPKCHPETRTKLLDKLYHWTTNPHSRFSIQWLHGPAGAGKSAIMQVLCRRLQDAGKLGGSFFFKRGHPTRGNAKVLFATLAYQLALHQQELKSPILQRIEANPSIVARDMDVQLRTLILEPCKLLQDTAPSILLIDGLDECEGHNIQQEILCLIGSTVSCHCLRILFASRSEAHIQETLEDRPLRGLFKAINIEQSFEDIRTYLRAEFSRIHHKHRTMRNIATPWPSSEILEMLVKKSSGYFIYASTVVKFIDDEYSRPSVQLDIIQNTVPQNSVSPFEALDQLYIQILSVVPVRYHHCLCKILSVLINYPQPIGAKEIDGLFGLESGDVSLILRPLHSVLKLDSKWDTIQMHHASFRDFLGSQERSSIFYVGSPQYRAHLTCEILKVLAYSYNYSQKKQVKLWFNWTLHPDHWIDYITSVPPSAEFVPLIRLVNPDFIFVYAMTYAMLDKFLYWLKGMVPIPEDLIQQWKNYCFMHLFMCFEERIWDDLLKGCHAVCPETSISEVFTPSLHVIHALLAQNNSDFGVTLEACRKLLLRSPDLIHIFKVIKLLISFEKAYMALFQMALFQVHIILDLSWIDIQKCICSLRPLVTQYSSFFYTLLLSLPALCWELESLYPQAIVSRDLACGFLRLMHQIKNQDLPLTFWRLFTNGEENCREWGRYVRASPPSDPELIQALEKFSPAWDVFVHRADRLEPSEFYDVVQWLKASPNPCPDLIEQWQDYLMESMVRTGSTYSDGELEKRWLNHLKREAYFHESDTQVIQCWEHVLSKVYGSGSIQEEEEEEEDCDREWCDTTFVKSVELY